jgi:hypothetical protein
MGPRSLIVFAAACGGGTGGTTPKPPAALPDRVAADFEAAVKASKDAYVELFDFAAVGEYEILLHRYDLNGRGVALTDAQKTQFIDEDGTPYPATRERRNVGNFYTILAQRTVGTGGCTAHPPRKHYGQLLAKPFEPLPPASEAMIAGETVRKDTPAGYQVLRDHANAWLAKGGAVGITCTGGQGGLAIVYTGRDSARGYDLITIYDD